MVDGRKMGSTGEHWEGAESKDERSKRQVELTEPVTEVRCVERDDLFGSLSGKGGFECQVGGRTKTYSNRTNAFTDLEMDADDVDEYRGRDGEYHIDFRFNEPTRCEVDRTEYQYTDQEKTLRCRN